MRGVAPSSPIVTEILSVKVRTTSLISVTVLLLAGFAVNAASISTGSTFSI